MTDTNYWAGLIAIFALAFISGKVIDSKLEHGLMPETAALYP